MAYTLQQTINWAQPYIQYVPLTAGVGLEPALSIASMVRNTICNPPFVWPWNRNEFAVNSSLPEWAAGTYALGAQVVYEGGVYQCIVANSDTTWTPAHWSFESYASLIANQQDYVFDINDFAFLEKVSLLDAEGMYGYEVKSIHNTNVLGVPASENETGQPNAVCVKLYNPESDVTLRFLPVPEQEYTGVVTYQQLVFPFRNFSLTSAANSQSQTLEVTQVAVANGFAVYTMDSPQTVPNGNANPYIGVCFTITGFSNTGNNITIQVVSTTATTITCVATSQVPEVLATGHATLTGNNLTSYNGVFNVNYFKAGAQVQVSGFSTAGNNGTFTVVYVHPTTIVVTNPNGASETPAGGASLYNCGWSPIPDSFMDIFNNLFLAEAMAVADDPREQVYRMRGIAALLSKAEGLTEMQVNAFLAQFISRGLTPQQIAQLKTQQGHQARGI